MSEFGGLQKHEHIQHAPILGYEARHCCCWPAEGSPNFPLGKGTKYNRKTEEEKKRKKNTHTHTNRIIETRTKKAALAYCLRGQD